jgi:NDP-sugar pyrophosphorylase family protein
MPKALLDVQGRPFIAWQLEWIHQQGGRRVVICAGHLGEQIEAEIGNGAAFGLDVAFVYDGPVLLGTAGALLRALPILGDAPFFVLYGDSYLPIAWQPVQAAFEASHQLALMTVYRNEDQLDRSNVELADGRILVYDKRQHAPRMQHIDYGLGLLRPEALAAVPLDAPADLAAVYADLLARGQLAAYEVHERFYEIGSIDGLEATRRFLAGTSS